MTQYVGCPCGCLTKTPYFLDPDCTLAQPHRARRPLPAYRPLAADGRDALNRRLARLMEAGK